jgi:hypothetical protein
MIPSPYLTEPGSEKGFPPSSDKLFLKIHLVATTLGISHENQTEDPTTQPSVSKKKSLSRLPPANNSSPVSEDTPQRSGATESALRTLRCEYSADADCLFLRPRIPLQSRSRHEQVNSVGVGVKIWSWISRDSFTHLIFIRDAIPACKHSALARLIPVE